MLFKTKKICNCHYVRKHLNLFKAKFKSSKRVFFIKLIEMVSFKLISNKAHTQTKQKYHFLRLQNNRTTNSNTQKINPPPSDASRESYWLTLKPHRTNKKAHGKNKVIFVFLEQRSEVSEVSGNRGKPKWDRNGCFCAYFRWHGGVAADKKRRLKEKKHTSVERWKESIIIQSHKFQDKTLYIERQQKQNKNPIAKNTSGTNISKNCGA